MDSGINGCTMEMQWIDWSLKLYPIIVKMSQIIYDIIILFLKNSCKTKLTKQIMQLIWCLNEGNRRDTGCDIPASIVNLFMKMVFLYFSFKCWSILVLKWPKPKVCGKKSIAACSFCHFILNRRKCHVLVRVDISLDRVIKANRHQGQPALSTQHSGPFKYSMPTRFKDRIYSIKGIICQIVLKNDD